METLNPRTYKQSIGMIQGKQADFSAGLFNDGPASNVPYNGVRRLVNFVNRGDMLDTRTGAKKWSTTGIPGLAGRTGYAATSTVSGSLRTITKTAGTDFTADDVGHFFVHDDGTHERIVEFVSATVVKAFTQASTAKTSTAGYLRAQINCFYYHATRRKLVVQVGEMVYFTDVDTIAWEQAFLVGLEGLHNSRSMVDEYEDLVVLFNSYGMFKIDLSTEPSLYYKANLDCPTSILFSAGAFSESRYGRRRLYSMVRLSGDGYDRDRLTPGVKTEWESGPSIGATDSSTGAYQDFGESWKDAPWDDSTGAETVDYLVPPLFDVDTEVPHQQATHYRVYETLTIGSFGVDPLNPSLQNSPVLFVWAKDVPVITPIVASRTGTTVTATVGVFTPNDVGSIIYFETGDIGTITAYTNPTTVTTTESDNVASGSAAFGTLRIGTAAQAVSGSEIAGNATVTASSATVGFTASDVGRVIFWANGQRSTVVRYIDANGVEVAESDAIDSTAFGMDPYRRSFRDDQTDDVLASKIKIGALQTRFWEPLPRANVGVIVPGFVYCGVAGDSKLYYGEVIKGYEETMGYHVPGVQEAVLKKPLSDLTEHIDALVIKCRGATYSVPINSYITQEDESAGTAISIIRAINTLDTQIGKLPGGGKAFDDKGNELVVTDEPGIRLFIGSGYGENLAEGRIMDIVKSLQPRYVCGFTPETGFVIYALDTVE